MSKTAKSFILSKDEDSTMQRRQFVKGGVASFRPHEALYMVSAGGALALKPRQFQNYKGSASGSLMGPILLPPLDAAWMLHMEDE